MKFLTRHPKWVSNDLPKLHVHIAIWFFFLANTLISKIGDSPADMWLHHIGSFNLVVIGAFIAIFHILTDEKGYEFAPADRGDFAFFMIFVGLTAVGSLFATPYDTSFFMGFLGLYYLSSYAKIRHSNYIGTIYVALSLNGFLAPLIFMVFKDKLLIGEVEFAAMVNGFLGWDVSTSGTHMLGVSEQRLQLVGACSIFSNISLALLGYVAFRSVFKLLLKLHSYFIMVGLTIGLIILNAIRLGLMTRSESLYQYWHHGSGAVLIGVFQVILITAISLITIFYERRSCPVS